MDTAVLQSIWPQSDILLNATQLSSGVEVAGDDARLGCMRAALAAGRRVSMSAVGGSITAGSSFAAGVGSAADFLYHRKVARALDARFPVMGGHGQYNGGVPGTGPTYMEHCVHDHLPSDVQLVLLEYAVNTDRNPVSFERLLRRLLVHPRRPGVIVVNAHRWRAIRPHDGRTDKCWHKSWPVDMAHNQTQWLAQAMGRVAGLKDELAADEDAIASLCAHYNVPLVSMRGALVGAVRAGAVAIPAFMNDCKHPSGVGHSFLAQLVLHRLLHAPPSAAPGAPQTSCEAATASAPPLALREPLFGVAGRDMTSSVCARGEQMKAYVVHSDGFNLTDEGRGKGKLGYLAHDVGRSIAFCLPWPSETSTARPPSILWLGFLRSYEHMGRVRVSCTGQCACAPELIDGHDIKDGVSVTDVRGIRLRPNRYPSNEAEACCRVRAHIAPGTSSGEHKFKVMSLLLGGADAHHLQVFSLRVAASASEGPVGKAKGSSRRRSGRRRGNVRKPD